MPDSEAKKRWMKENTTVIRVKLNHNTDAEIVEYIKAVDSVAGLIKKALKEYIQD